jgi:AcrR family transcriptional regulator
MTTLTRVPWIVDTVNMKSKTPEDRGYHHGNLREALIDAGVALARTGGPTAVVLRAASRDAGVSHNAAYRHFASQEDLVAAVAERCMAKLGALMVERIDQVTARGAVPRAQARLQATGRAYIDFARSEPGWFRTAFSSARPHGDDAPPQLPSAADAEMDPTKPYLLLGARLNELVAVGAMTPEQRDGAEYAAWSSVHGISSLLLDGPLRDLPEPEVQRAIDKVLGVVNRGLA